MREDTKSVLVLLVAVLVVVGGLCLLGSASGSGSDWSEWYLGWLLYPLYIFVPAGLLWLLDLFLASLTWSHVYPPVGVSRSVGLANG